MAKQGGSIANGLGSQLENLVEEIIKNSGYEYVVKSKFTVATNALKQKLYTKQMQICESIYSTEENKHVCKADFVIFNPQNNEKYMIIECKSQTSGGSVDEKYPYLNENIKDKYPYKTIIILDTPAAKKGAVAWLKLQEKINPNLTQVFQNFSEFRAWAHKNLG